MPVYSLWHLLDSNHFSRAPDTAAVGILFNVFSYDSVLGRDSNLSPTSRQADALRVEQRLRASAAI